LEDITRYKQEGGVTPNKITWKESQLTISNGKKNNKGVPPSKNNRSISREIMRLSSHCNSPVKSSAVEEEAPASAVKSCAVEEHPPQEEDGDDDRTVDSSIPHHQLAISASGTSAREKPALTQNTTTDQKTFLKSEVARMKKLSQDDCISSALKLQKDLWALRDKYNDRSEDYSRQLDNVHEQLLAANREKEAMQKKLEATSAKLREANAYTNNGAALLPHNKEVEAMVESKTKTIMWSMVKFIQSPKDLENAGRLLVKHARIDRHHIDTKVKKAAFINTYKVNVRKAIFQRRNYVAAEHKKVMLKRHKSHGSMPTVDQLLKCLRRDITTDEDFEIFAFYWEELLPKQVGPLVWCKEVRNYETICQAMRRGVPNLPMITSMDEAFTVLLIQNSIGRWKKELERDRTSTTNSSSDQNKKTKEQTTKTNHNGRFTTTDKGQNEWGGWSQTGLKLFREYKDYNKAARKERKTRAVEDTCLEMLKKKHKIVCRDHKSQIEFERSNRRKRKRGVDEDLEQAEEPEQAIPEELLDNLSDDDDEEEFELELDAVNSKSFYSLPHLST
jgi:hypothetical protein